MKKLVLFVAVVSAASFASCKKDRTCKCDVTVSQTTTTTPNGGSTTTITNSDSYTTETVYTKAKKGNVCLSYESTDTNDNSGTGYTSETVTKTDASCTLSK